MMGFGNMMGGWGYGLGGGWWGIGLFAMLLQLLFWIGLIYVGVKLFRRFSYRGHSYGWDRRDSLDILRERYARGEISTEEYLQRKEDLMRY